MADRIGWSIPLLARAFPRSRSYIGGRIRKGTVAHVRVGRRTIILEGDAQALAPWAVPQHEDGRDVLDRAWQGRHRLRLVEVAESLDVHVRTLKRLALAGELPAQSHARRPWWILRDDLVRWLRDHRAPARWERTA